VREHATEVISALWDAPPRPAPALQAKLDHLAERVMDGDINMQKAFKEVSKLLKSGTVLGGAITMAGISSTAAQPPDLSTVSLAPGAKYLAIGEASGDFGTGSGVEQTLLLIVTASQAK